MIQLAAAKLAPRLSWCDKRELPWSWFETPGSICRHTKIRRKAIWIMCGISGFLGDFDPMLLVRMSDSIAHRGPDDYDQWYDRASRIGLAHRRLSIIDLRPEARQPMSNEDNTLFVTYNGEIYNFLEIRSDLIAKGHRFKSRSDTEILLHLYEEEGVDMLRRLNGIFAFALWDASKHQLFIARDGIGVKPLYYTQLDAGFMFASEMKALLLEPRVPRETDIEAMHYYLAYLWAPAPYTMLRSVRKLPPGTAMLVREGRVERQWTYYDLPYDGKYMTGSEDTIARELKTRLDDAVGRQMVSDVPVGAFLSGGLDSSSIVTSMVRAKEDTDIPCYSIGFGDDEIDGMPADLPYARRVANHLGVELREIIVTPAMIDLLEDILFALDEPQADPAPISVFLIAEQARAEGIKVLMSGAGGDDIFSGYRRHTALTFEKYWSWFPQSIRSGMAWWAKSMDKSSPFGRRLAKMFSHADLTEEERLLGYFLWSSEASRRALYSPDVRHALDGVDASSPLLSSLRRIPDETEPLNRMLYLDTKHFLPDHNLNYTDKAGMACGVEVRVPLLDYDLVEFASRIPPEMKQKGRLGKAIFKKAMEPCLPVDVIYRPKTGFGAPVRRWLRRELKEMLEEVLSPRALTERGWFDPTAVNGLIEADRQGRIDGAYTIFSLLTMELWARKFLDGRGLAGSKRDDRPITVDNKNVNQTSNGG